MNILNEFFNGNISPSEKFIKKDSEYYKLNCGLMGKIEEFTGGLKEKEKVIFDEIEDYVIKLCALCEEERYIEGFCTGAKLMLEVMNYKSGNFK